MDLDIEISQVVFVRDSTDTRDTKQRYEVRGCDSCRVSRHKDGGGRCDLRLSHQPLRLFDNALRESHLGHPVVRRGQTV